MNCKKCGAYLSEEAHFCSECGSVVGEEAAQREDIYCSACGAKLEPGNSFCGECGKAVVVAVPDEKDPTTYLLPQDANIDHQTPICEQKQQRSNNNVLLLAIVLTLIAALTGGAIWFMVSRYSSPRVNVDLNPIGETSTPAADHGQLENDDEPTMDNDSVQSQPQIGSSEADTAGDYLFDSDTRYITEEYLATKSQYQVRLILNEIYARHGYIFSTQEYRDYFSKKSWYTPRYTSDVEAESYFNDIERQNKNTIANYEKAKGWR